MVELDVRGGITPVKEDGAIFKNSIDRCKKVSKHIL
jgi:hypothetical protein